MSSVWIKTLPLSFLGIGIRRSFSSNFLVELRFALADALSRNTGLCFGLIKSSTLSKVLLNYTLDTLVMRHIIR